MKKEELSVLLVEDNPGDAFLIKFYLGESTNPTFLFHHAENIQSTREFLKTKQFDIILMDLHLPDSVGMETIKSINESFPDNLIIILTGLTDERVGLEAVRFGAQDFLVKGKFDGKVLISSILFAFERFHLKSQISQVSHQLDQGLKKLDKLQKIMNLGYFEFNLETKILYLSPFTIELLNTPNKGEERSLEVAMNAFENPEEVLKDLEELKSGVHEKAFLWKYKYVDKKLRFNCKVEDQIVYGVIEQLD